MKDSKSLYSRCFSEYRLSDENLKKLQHELLGMLLDVKAVCEKYQIEYLLDGGSILGAVRHQGFIPWDDDIDIMMLRSEYERFKEVFLREFPGKYELGEPLLTPHYVSKMVKIYKKGTMYVEIPTAGVNGPNMIFVDLFLIDNVPAPGFRRKAKALLYNTLFKAASLCIDYSYPSPPIMEKCRTDRELREYYGLRRALGFFFAHIGGMRFYLKLCEKISDQKKVTGWLGTPADGDYELGIFPAEILTNYAMADFCGYQMKIPQDYDTYLTKEYGDYRQIPPPEKREFHCAYQISFGEQA